MAPELLPQTLGDHVDRLYRAARALCGTREDAEDLVQETFARVLAKPREIETDDPLPYLLGVLRNAHVSSLRARGRRPVAVALDEERAGGGPSPDETIAAREIFAAIAELPREFREVIAAVDVAGLAYAEAAEALDVPQGTVMSRLYRGRARLADRLRA